MFQSLLYHFVQEHLSELADASDMSTHVCFRPITFTLHRIFFQLNSQCVAKHDFTVRNATNAFQHGSH